MGVFVLGELFYAGSAQAPSWPCPLEYRRASEGRGAVAQRKGAVATSSINSGMKSTSLHGGS